MTNRLTANTVTKFKCQQLPKQAASKQTLSSASTGVKVAMTP